MDDQQSDGTIGLPNGANSKKISRGGEQLDYEQAMRDLQNKLDAVPDVYEDPNRDIFERSNKSSNSDENREVQPYYGYVKRNKRLKNDYLNNQQALE